MCTCDCGRLHYRTARGSDLSDKENMSKLSRTSVFESAFYKVELQSLAHQAWNSGISSGSVEHVIAQLGSMLGLDLTDSIEWFSQATNPFDPEDVLSDNLTVAQFKRRIGNYLLYKLYEEQAPHAQEVDNFIAQKRAQAAQQFRTPQPKKAALSPSPQQPAVGKPWIRPLLEAHTDEILKQFEAFGNSRVIDGSSAKHLFQEVLELCRLVVSDKDLKDFYSQIDSRLSSLNFEEFLQSMLEWSASHQSTKRCLSNMLELTILEFQQLPVPKTLSRHAKDLQSKLNYLANKARAAHSNNILKDIEAAQRSGIREVFFFYAKAMKTYGPTATFDQIEENNTTWNIAKFLKFATDFGLLAHEELLTKEELTNIFKTTASFTRILSLDQFTEALDLIASVYYGAEYDRMYNTAYNIKTDLEKRSLLYELLQFGNRNRYVKKLRGFGLAFSKEKGNSRIPPTETSNQYTFKLPPQRKLQLDTWKQSKPQPVAQAEPNIRQRSLPRGSEKPDPYNAGGYSIRNRKSKGSPIKGSNSIKNILDRKPLTFKELQRLSVHEEDFPLALGSDEETDQYINHLYGSARNKQHYAYGLKRQHDLMSRGLKVVAKNKKRVF